MLTVKDIKNEWKNNKIYRISIILLVSIFILLGIILLKEKIFDLLAKILLPSAIGYATYKYQKIQTKILEEKQAKERFDFKFKYYLEINNLLEEYIKYEVFSKDNGYKDTKSNLKSITDVLLKIQESSLLLDNLSCILLNDTFSKLLRLKYILFNKIFFAKNSTEEELKNYNDINTSIKKLSNEFIKNDLNYFLKMIEK